MRYQQPWGVSDPQAPYINGDPSQGQQGSIPPAAAFEQPQREIVGLITKAGFTPSDTNLDQLSIGVRSQRLNYAIDTGTQNNLTVAFDPPFAPATNPYTPGLTLHVRVRFTNGPGQVTIDAGGGRVPIRKMNNADVGDGELPVNSIATLVFDGTAFQLSNFGGGGGGGIDTTITVNIPYAVDQSTAPGTIRAIFNPPIPAPVAGDIIAVKCAFTAPGATVMLIDSYAPVNLLPNGGGIMLQGDIAADDVVQFFFDGVNLRFAPNPEINAPVDYTVGPGQQFLTVDEAMDALKRKTIGANGFVTLQMTTGVVPGPINVSHPSGDRLRIRGTMLGAAPLPGDFQKTGNSAQQRANDAVYNINMMRTRYGTEITIPPTGVGIRNAGPGMVQFQDLLIVGAQLPTPPGAGWQQNGASLAAGFSLQANNVAVWGSQVGFNSAGGLYCNDCYACWNSHVGYHSAGSGMWTTRSGAFGNFNGGFACTFGSMWAQYCTSMMNAGQGFWSDNGSGAALWWCTATGNGTDIFSNVGSSALFVYGAPGAAYGSSSPLANQVGNLNSIFAIFTVAPGP